MKNANLRSCFDLIYSMRAQIVEILQNDIQFKRQKNANRIISYKLKHTLIITINRINHDVNLRENESCWEEAGVNYQPDVR